MQASSDINKFMKCAIREAKKAFAEDEVPVGAIIVKEGKIIARAHNQKEKKNDATAHAEIECIKKASKKLGNWWLEDCDIYVTLEPCSMCAGAIVNSRIKRLYFGAKDPKAGCCGSVIDLFTPKLFNHKLEVKGGVLPVECGSLLTDFFSQKRAEKKNNL